MTSVERILEYTKLDQEADAVTDLTPPAKWPSEGDICFKNVSLRYNENSPKALNNLTFTIKGGERVSIE